VLCIKAESAASETVLIAARTTAPRPPAAAAHLEAHHKALHLLTVWRKVARLDGQAAPSAVAQHGLTVGVPRHTVGALCFKHDTLWLSVGWLVGWLGGWLGAWV